MKRILLLSPYDILSHRYWYEGMIEALPEYQWTVLNLPPRYFAWRMRSNSLSWAFQERESLEADYDLIIACSMTDLSALRGFIPNLASTPTLVYCHENQFYYPSQHQQQGQVEQQMLQLYTLLCADHIAFNSHFNRQSCLAGIEQLLKKFPDFVPKGLPELLSRKSSVLPVPLKEEMNVNPIEKPKEFSLTWNHRWEYDKGCTQLLALVEKIVESKLDIRINILGQSFRNIPKEMESTINLLKDNGLNGHIGYIEHRRDYLKILNQSHLVLSTSLHEFQGLSIMEAVRLGCVPVLPNRLVYPELFDEDFLYESHLNSPLDEALSARNLINRYYDLWANGKLDDLDLDRISIPTWEAFHSKYQGLIEATCQPNKQQNP